MVWMAGAIDVAGNLEERHWAGFPKMTKAMFDKWGCKTVGEPAPCQDPDSEYGRGFPEWNVWGDVPAVDYIFRTTSPSTSRPSTSPISSLSRASS